MGSTVSIPFERESLFKVVTQLSTRETWACLVSIPFERESLFKEVASEETDEIALESFNSLRAGKSIQSVNELTFEEFTRKFQFPSSGKVYSKELGKEKSKTIVNSFNSLRAGKSIQRSKKREKGLPPIKCFNSLRAGKSIQRSEERIRKEEIRAKNRFNSLRAGKSIQRVPILSPVRPWLHTPQTKRELRGAFFFLKFTP